MEKITYLGVKEIIANTIESQSDTFSAKDIIFSVRDQLSGTGLDEKKAFTEVARMCGRELRIRVDSGKIFHTADGRYSIKEKKV